MDHITLQKVDEANFLDCFALKLKPEQEEFVSHPIRSLAQAYVYYKQCTPFAVCHGGEVVGYVMVIYDYDEETYNIWHLMIDKAHQGRAMAGRPWNRPCHTFAQSPSGTQAGFC